MATPSPESRTSEKRAAQINFLRCVEAFFVSHSDQFVFRHQPGYSFSAHTEPALADDNFLDISMIRIIDQNISLRYSIFLGKRPPNELCEGYQLDIILPAPIWTLEVNWLRAASGGHDHDLSATLTFALLSGIQEDSNLTMTDLFSGTKMNPIQAQTLLSNLQGLSS